MTDKRLLTEEELREIAERERKATPGPWDNVDDVFVIVGDGFIMGEDIAACVRELDAEFIAAARTDISRLLAHIQAQAAEIERMKMALERICDEPDSLHDAQIIAEGAL